MDSSVRRRRTSSIVRSGLLNTKRRTGPDGAQNKPHDISLTRADVEAAFSFFDLQNKKVLKPRDLKVRLSAFYPNMTNKEYRFLLDETEDGNFTVDSLWNIIEGFHGMQMAVSAPETFVSEGLKFETLREAFRIYDPQGRGVVDIEVLAGIMKRIGFGDLSQDEMDLLIQTADVDNDGKINFEDFRNLLKINRQAEGLNR